MSVCMCVYVIFVVFTDGESCTSSISTNPGTTQTGEYGLTRRTYFVARRLELVAVAGLLWISRCVLGAARFRIFFPIFFFKDRTRPVASIRPPCLIYLSTSNEVVCALRAKASSYWGAYKVPLFHN